MEEKYTIERQGGILRLKTGSFMAQMGSVLHSGIYSKELSSLFVASLISFIYLIVSGARVWLDYLFICLIFCITFPVCRGIIFKSPILDVLFDLDNDIVRVRRQGLLTRTLIDRKVSDISGIETASVEISPQNDDGIAFVKKIALQHGTIIPGFGETEFYHTIRLAFADKGLIIFSSKDCCETGKVASEIRDFMKAALPHMQSAAL